MSELLAPFDSLRPYAVKLALGYVGLCALKSLPSVLDDGEPLPAVRAPGGPSVISNPYDEEEYVIEKLDSQIERPPVARRRRRDICILLFFMLAMWLWYTCLALVSPLDAVNWMVGVVSSCCSAFAGAASYLWNGVTIVILEAGMFCGNALYSVASNVYSFIEASCCTFGTMFLGAYNCISSYVSSILGPIYDYVTCCVQYVSDIIVNYLSLSWQAVFAVLYTWRGWVNSKMNFLMQGVIGMCESMYGVLEKCVNKSSMFVIGCVRYVVESVGRKAGYVLNKVHNFFRSIHAYVYGIFARVYTYVCGVYTSVYAYLENFIVNVFTKMKLFLFQILTHVKRMWSFVFQKMKNKLQEWLGVASNCVKSVCVLLRHTFHSLLQSATTGINFLVLNITHFLRVTLWQYYMKPNTNLLIIKINDIFAIFEKNLDVFFVQYVERYCLLLCSFVELKSKSLKCFITNKAAYIIREIKISCVQQWNLLIERSRNFFWNFLVERARNFWDYAQTNFTILVACTSVVLKSVWTLTTRVFENYVFKTFMSVSHFVGAKIYMLTSFCSENFHLFTHKFFVFGKMLKNFFVFLLIDKLWSLFINVSEKTRYIYWFSLQVMKSAWRHARNNSRDMFVKYVVPITHKTSQVVLTCANMVYGVWEAFLRWWGVPSTLFPRIIACCRQQWKRVWNVCTGFVRGFRSLIEWCGLQSFLEHCITATRYVIHAFTNVICVRVYCVMRKVFEGFCTIVKGMWRGGRHFLMKSCGLLAFSAKAVYEETKRHFDCVFIHPLLFGVSLLTLLFPFTTDAFVFVEWLLLATCAKCADWAYYMIHSTEVICSQIVQKFLNGGDLLLSWLLKARAGVTFFFRFLPFLKKCQKCERGWGKPILCFTCFVDTYFYYFLRRCSSCGKGYSKGTSHSECFRCALLRFSASLQKCEMCQQQQQQQNNDNNNNNDENRKICLSCFLFSLRCNTCQRGYKKIQSKCFTCFLDMFLHRCSVCHRGYQKIYKYCFCCLLNSFFPRCVKCGKGRQKPGCGDLCFSCEISRKFPLCVVCKRGKAKPFCFLHCFQCYYNSLFPVCTVCKKGKQKLLCDKKCFSCQVGFFFPRCVQCLKGKQKPLCDSLCFRCKFNSMLPRCTACLQGRSKPGCGSLCFRCEFNRLFPRCVVCHQGKAKIGCEGRCVKCTMNAMFPCCTQCRVGKAKPMTNGLCFKCFGNGMFPVCSGCHIGKAKLQGQCLQCCVKDMKASVRSFLPNKNNNRNSEVQRQTQASHVRSSVSNQSRLRDSQRLYSSVRSSNMDELSSCVD